MNLVDSLKTILEVLNVKIDRKADQSEVNLKATKSEMKSALDLKADKLKMTTELGKKASKSEVSAGLSEKLDIVEAEDTYGLKYAEQTESITDGSFVVIKEDYTKLFLKTDSTISGKPLDYIGCIYDYSNITLEPNSNYFFIIDNKTITSGEKQSEMAFSLCMNDFDHYKSNIIYKEDEIIVYGDTSIIDEEVDSPYWAGNVLSPFLLEGNKNITFKTGWNGLINLIDLDVNEIILPEYVDNSKFQIQTIAGKAKKIVFPKNLTHVVTGSNRTFEVDEIVFPEVPFDINAGFRRQSKNYNIVEGVTYIPSNVTAISDHSFEGYEALNYTGTATGAPWGAHSAGYCEDGLIYTSAEKTELIGVYGDQFKYEVPDTVTTISHKLKNQYRMNQMINQIINVPSTVTSIVDNAFDGFCAVFYLGSATFARLYSTYLNPEFDNDVVYTDSNKTQILCVDPELEQFTIPNSVTSMRDNAFKNSKITSLVLSNTQINNSSFGLLTNLTSLTVDNPNPATLSSIPRSKLEEIIVMPTSTDYVVQEGLNAIIRNVNDSHNLIMGCKNTTNIPSGTLEISANAFAGSDIENLVLPDTIVRIKPNAFLSCKKLRTISYLDSLQELGDEAFSGCILLEEIRLPSSLQTLGTQVFYGCTNLNLILEIHCDPEVSIHELMANKVKNLQPWGEGAHLNTENIMKWGAKNYNKVVDSDGTVYENENKQHLVYAPYIENYTIPTNVQIIFAGAFKDNPITKRIDGSKITYNYDLPNNSFEGCINLEELILPKGLTALPSYFCKDCTNLEKIEMPNTIATIGDYGVFSGCKSLRKLRIPDGVTELPSTFYWGGLDYLDLNNVTTCRISFNSGEHYIFNIDAPKLNSLYRTSSDAISVLNINCPDIYIDCFLKNGTRTQWWPQWDF